jgi:hypothetical protein
METIEKRYKNYILNCPNSNLTLEDFSCLFGYSSRPIDNLNQIKELLNFEDEGDFYMIYILKRKKDQPENEKDNHQSVRTIKTYCVESIEYLEKRYEEIKQLCEIFKARAYIHIQKQNHKDVSLNMLASLAERVRDGHHKQKNLFDSVVGKLKTLEKRWIVDVDTKDMSVVNEIKFTINKLCRPNDENKIWDVIPTKSGYHIITDRFDIMEFKKSYPNVDIQKKNPTLLYHPSSLI